MGDIAIRLGPLSHLLTPELLCQFRLRLGFPVDELRPIDHILEIGCPVLIVAGELDEHTTLSEAGQMYDAAVEPYAVSYLS